MYSEDLSPRMERREFLRLGGAGLAGAVLLAGTPGSRVVARTTSSLQAEFEDAAKKYRVPEELLLAMGYVNTLWEMPPPEASDYEEGDLHGRGTYGIMQLVKNPWRNTLGKAAQLTGHSEEELKNDPAANVRGGAAVLAYMHGADKSSDLNDWYETTVEYGDADLYAHEVFQTLEEGATATISTGETLQLAPQDVEVPLIVIAQSRADYGRAVWRPAHRSNYTNRNRGVKQISMVIVHVAQGSYSGTISWFKNRRSNVSAHYVVSRRGRVTQCVHNEDIAWHAGNWRYNRKSIGIEHAGYAGDPKTWTTRMYRSSAKLSAYLSRRFNIPIDRRHFIGHRQVPGVNKTCPGRYFDWDRYLRLVRHYRRRLR